jgi:hypothetical protein
MYKKYIYPSAIMLSALILVACGSSSDDEEAVYTESYLQFYNDSANSAATTMSESDGSDLGSTNYGEATALLSSESGDVDLEFYRSEAGVPFSSAHLLPSVIWPLKKACCRKFMFIKFRPRT